jgi:hypothetical protein
METEKHSECWKIQTRSSAKTEKKCNSHCSNFCPSTESPEVDKIFTENSIDCIGHGECLPCPGNTDVVLQELIIHPVRDDEDAIPLFAVDMIGESKLFCAYQPISDKPIHPSISSSILRL